MKNNVLVKKLFNSSFLLALVAILTVMLPEFAMAASFSTTSAKQTIFGSGSIVADAITFVFWLLAFIELIDFLANLNTSGFFMKILRPAFMILFALKWQTIVGWFI